MIAEKIACVVLASGLSSRFGEGDKLAADLCGHSMLSYVLRTAKAVGFGQVFCVVKQKAFQAGAGVTWIENDNPSAGQGHALRLGLRGARDLGWKNCVVMLGDMPLVSDAYLRNMISNYNKKQSIISISESYRLPPALFNSDAIDKILSQNSAMGARKIFDQLNLFTLPLDAEAALDVDTPADLARVENIMKARKI